MIVLSSKTPSGGSALQFSYYLELDREEDQGSRMKDNCIARLKELYVRQTREHDEGVVKYVVDGQTTLDTFRVENFLNDQLQEEALDALLTLGDELPLPTGPQEGMSNLEKLVQDINKKGSEIQEERELDDPPFKLIPPATNTGHYRLALRPMSLIATGKKMLFQVLGFEANVQTTQDKKKGLHMIKNDTRERMILRANYPVNKSLKINAATNVSLREQNVRQSDVTVFLRQTNVDMEWFYRPSASGQVTVPMTDDVKADLDRALRKVEQEARMKTNSMTTVYSRNKKMIDLAILKSNLENTDKRITLTLLKGFDEALTPTQPVELLVGTSLRDDPNVDLGDDDEAVARLGPISKFGVNLIQAEAPLHVVMSHPASPSTSEYAKRVGSVRTIGWVSPTGSVSGEPVNLGRYEELNFMELKLLDRNLDPIIFNHTYNVIASFKKE